MNQVLKNIYNSIASYSYEEYTIDHPSMEFSLWLEKSHGDLLECAVLAHYLEEITIAAYHCGVKDGMQRASSLL